MCALDSFTLGLGNNDRVSHPPAVSSSPEAEFPTQASGFHPPHFPFQSLPKPLGPAPYRYNLSHLLTAADMARIEAAGSMVFHTVGDTGDERGRQQDFVAAMMTADAQLLPPNQKPAFFYHLGDIVYFAGDIDKYGNNFYETYKEYPGFIVSIAGNHDCQPDDPQDGPVDPKKFPLDGWVQNFMSKTPGKRGSLKTGSARTQMDLPNVFWTFNTPFATIVGLFSNVGEVEGEIHPDQVKWLQGELAAADPKLALIVTVHHPPFSGDTEHSGSSVVYQVLFDAFKQTGRFPHLILSGHVHNYQRFTHTVPGPHGNVEVTCLVAGNGGYTNLGKLHKIGNAFPTAPLQLGPALRLEQYDQDNYGFLRLEVNAKTIVGTPFSAPYSVSGPPATKKVESFSIDVASHVVTTL